MSEQDNIQLVKQAYARFMKRDIPGMLALMADDIKWTLDQTENVPFAGTRRGKEQVAEFFKLLDASQLPLQFEPRDFIAQGDKVVVLGHSAWSVKATDLIFESDWAEVFTIRNGKIAAFREFADTAAGAAAYRPAEYPFTK